MNLLSIQSHVAYGHVGNASAAFAMQRLGHEVWAVHTVQFSNHTGYGAWRGQVFSGEVIRDVVGGIADRGVLSSCDGVLSGYMGDAGIGEAILDAVRQVKAANPEALYCCDPVIGDVGRGVFVRPGIPEFMRDHAVPAADVITPNQFELDFLAGHETRTPDGVRAALARVHAQGPRIIMVTSYLGEDTPSDCIDMLASDGARLVRVRTPLLPISVNGAGDAISALFFVHYLKERDVARALVMAAGSVFGLLKRTSDAGSRELLLVAAQDEIVAPSHSFFAEDLP